MGKRQCTLCFQKEQSIMRMHELTTNVRLNLKPPLHDVTPEQLAMSRSVYGVRLRPLVRPPQALAHKHLYTHSRNTLAEQKHVRMHAHIHARAHTHTHTLPLTLSSKPLTCTSMIYFKFKLCAEISTLIWWIKINLIEDLNGWLWFEWLVGWLVGWFAH